MCVCAVVGSSAAANAGTEARVVTYRYSVKITGHAAVYSDYNHAVINGTASETVAWTTTFPTARLVVRPTGAYGKVPAGYSLQGNGSGHSDISLHLLRQGQYEHCDWSATYGRDVKMLVLGWPWLATGSRYHLDLYDTWRGSFPDEPNPQDQCQVGHLQTTVEVKGTSKLEGSTAMQLAFTQVTKEFRAPQPRSQLSPPLAALTKGRNLTLRLSGTLANDYVDHGSAGVTITFTRHR